MTILVIEHQPLENSYQCIIVSQRKIFVWHYILQVNLVQRIVGQIDSICIINIFYFTHECTCLTHAIYIKWRLVPICQENEHQIYYLFIRGPEKVLEKNKRKAEKLIEEVQIIKVWSKEHHRYKLSVLIQIVFIVRTKYNPR